MTSTPTPRRLAAGAAAAIMTTLAVPFLTAAGAAAAVSPPHQAAAAASGGTLRAWGANGTGQFGNGTTTESDTPVRVRLPVGVRVTQVREGCFHTVALTSTGKVLAWGDNDSGQLGIGSTVPSKTPRRVKIPAGTRVTAVRAGCAFSLAVTSTGGLLAWGDNFFGQLGDGTTTNRVTPVPVSLPPGTTVKAVTAGSCTPWH